MATTPASTFQQWAHHRCWVQDLADAGYWCVNIGKMHFSPRDVPGGFHERVIVENPTNKVTPTVVPMMTGATISTFMARSGPTTATKVIPIGCANIKACPGISKSVSTATSLSATRR
ncbi:MAG: hypothetical protein R2867_30865 [Caldilineaceae bacterium]